MRCTVRKGILIVLICALLLLPVCAADISEQSRQFGLEKVKEALPEEAEELMGQRDVTEAEGLGDGISRIVRAAAEKSRGTISSGMALCAQILAIVLLSAVLRGVGGDAPKLAMHLAGVLAIGAVCLGSISGFFTRAAQTVDSMTTFSGFLFTALATTTAATGAVGTSTTLYGVTALVLSVMAKAVQAIFIPGISCYMALAVADGALGDGSLKPAGDTLKQLLSSALKFAVLLFTAYLSISGVISGSADSSAVRAAKLAITTAVPVVGSMIADASETLLVSAGLLRSGVGVFGLLGVLAVSIGPFLETGVHYLMLKITAASAALVGEKELSGLVGAMAGALGLLTAVTGVCTVIVMIGCVCFMKATGP